jgi:WD40 repeat protein
MYYSWESPNLSTGTKTTGYGSNSNQGFSWHPDANIFALSTFNNGDASPLIFDYRTETPIQIVIGGAADSADQWAETQFSPQGDMFAAVNYGTGKKGTNVWEVDASFNFTGPILPPGQDNTVIGGNYGIAWSKDGKYLFSSAGNANRLHIWRREGSSFVEITPPSYIPTGYIYGIEWSPDEAFIAIATQNAADNDGFYLYSVSGETLTKVDVTVSETMNGAYEVKWSPDGRFLVVQSLNNGYYYIFRRETNDTFTEIQKLTINDDYGANMDFHPSSEYFVCYGFGSQILYTYKIIGETFTELSAAPHLAGASWGNVEWNKDGRFIGVALQQGFGIWKTSEALTRF